MHRGVLARDMPTWGANCEPLPRVVDDVPVIVVDEYRVLEGGGQRVAIVELPSAERRRVYVSDLRPG